MGVDGRGDGGDGGDGRKWGGRGEGIVFNGNRVSALEDENILEMEDGDGYTAV